MKEAWKSFNGSDEHSFVKIAESRLNIEVCCDALKEIYNRFDTDQDKFLNEVELHNFMMACNKNLCTNKEEYNAFLDGLGEDKTKGLSINGFMQWHKRGITTLVLTS